ncbi:hypothetical protein COW36_17005 [bacterium (Candidatus Blackallbacteria) CG17_big_fil_post_rev_8_21_14_2_50_48_46]|uniref:protein O-GlcNAc transferase n=1 Tax=bacterium (Candidatus Blackallbacteria) CG17_big_fil_post_rev_8_21_14_2_50_48_46 TaxID=2014261 RepID=A0A2M7G1T5_9BACT|nr:MAG: hypothetical protein COW64_09315 [bacterium (Candidatus Blackallbacteria) CG18_big_fil_WC_8_21_14_2_50_49_26]PIW15501.1 MAG: hypothetical protein COW36_17005 [bacterium (Candidatus Blackallbacteria) CG17_big_fil_post_rev_8_21_14_2_50_48_46]PIW48599.1 MAG: hypothetical protein COW20_08840 [bacterium (Candidatus Blackallbacteria) CG13_big_fil_rev_8_21_14_2_50_49_14]
MNVQKPADDHPLQAQALAEAGLSAQLKGELVQARSLYHQALALEPSLFQACFNLGLSYYPNRKQTGESIYWFRRTLALNPAHLKATMLLAECLYWQGEVKASLQTVLRTLPEGNPQAFSNWTAAEQLQLRKRQMMAESWVLKTAFALAEFSEQDFLQLLRAWAIKWADPLLPVPPAQAVTHSGKIRLGYFSQEFGGFSSSYLMTPLLAGHDRERFELIAFSDAPDSQASDKNFKPLFDRWVSVYGCEASETARLIKGHKIDILLDLGGHTHPERLLLFAGKPAPLQITGLGFGTPVALKAMDGFITDPQIFPAELAEWIPEEVCYLSSALHWIPPEEEIPIRSRPAERPFIFGSANGLYKLSEPCLNTWAEILKACPESYLSLKAAPLASAETRRYYHDFFSARGVNPNRLLLQATEGRRQHLENFYNGIDLALDPFPYHGGVTSCEALWMGVPVLAMAGRIRCAESILLRLGLEDWLMPDTQAYVQKASEIYRQPEILHPLKFSLRQKLLNSVFCDMPRYVRETEAHYLRLWQKISS